MVLVMMLTRHLVLNRLTDCRGVDLLSNITLWGNQNYITRNYSTRIRFKYYIRLDVFIIPITVVKNSPVHRRGSRLTRYTGAICNSHGMYSSGRGSPTTEEQSLVL